MMEQLAGTVMETTYRNEENGYTVLRLVVGRAQQTVVGAMPELSSGEYVSFEGDWMEHPVYGKQFSAKTCRITPPDSLSAMEKYLGSGLIRGIGPATAKLIVKAFGESTMDILDEHPERLTEVSGIGRKKAEMIIESYTQQMTMRRALVYLQNYGISPNLAVKIAKYYGEATVELVKQNPYRLVTDIDGVGFLTADRIALSMGVDPQSEYRLRSALYYLLNEAANGAGHTYLPRPLLGDRACALLHVARALVARLTSELPHAYPAGFRREAFYQRGLERRRACAPSAPPTGAAVQAHTLPGGLKAVRGRRQIFLCRPDGAPLCDLPPVQPQPLCGDWREWRAGSLCIVRAPIAPGASIPPTPREVLLPPQVLQSQPVLRMPQPHDRIRPLGAPGHKPLRRYLCDRGVDALWRPHIPVLAVHDEVLWVPGLCVSQALRLDAAPTDGVRLALQGDPGYLPPRTTKE